MKRVELTPEQRNKLRTAAAGLLDARDRYERANREAVEAKEALNAAALELTDALEGAPGVSAVDYDGALIRAASDWDATDAPTHAYYRAFEVIEPEVSL